MMEELKKKVNGVYGWSVEDGKPKPPKQDLPQAVKDRADYFWEMTEDGKIFWCGEWHPFRTKFTRKQLEDAGFGWVFDCPGVEVKEVE